MSADLWSDLADHLKKFGEPVKVFSSAEPRILLSQDESFRPVQYRQNVKIHNAAIFFIEARHKSYAVLLVSYRLNNPPECLGPVGCCAGYEDGHEFARSKTQLRTPFSSTLDGG